MLYTATQLLNVAQAVCRTRGVKRIKIPCSKFLNRDEYYVQCMPYCNTYVKIDGIWYRAKGVDTTENDVLYALYNEKLEEE